jgi:hypothetical protein
MPIVLAQIFTSLKRLELLRPAIPSRLLDAVAFENAIHLARAAGFGSKQEADAIIAGSTNVAHISSATQFRMR